MRVAKMQRFSKKTLFKGIFPKIAHNPALLCTPHSLQLCPIHHVVMPKRLRNGKNKQRKSTVIPVPRLRTVLPLSIRFRVQRSQAYSIYTNDLVDDVLGFDNRGGKVLILLKANYPGQIVNPDGGDGEHEQFPIQFGNPSATWKPDQIFPGSNDTAAFWGMSKIVGGVDEQGEMGDFLPKYNSCIVTRSTVKYSVIATENNPKTNVVSYSDVGNGGTEDGPPAQPAGFQSGRFYVAANTGHEITADKAAVISYDDSERHGWEDATSLETLREGTLPNWKFTIGDSIVGTRNAGISGELTYDSSDVLAAGNTDDVVDQTYSPGLTGPTARRFPAKRIWHRICIGPTDASRSLPDMKIRFVEEMEVMCYDINNEVDAWTSNIRGGQLVGTTAFDRSAMSMML
jgi:hypothetical protein